MFIDIVNIEIKSGDGGDGAVSFHRNALTAFGGPDGGDGGKGGDIVFKTDSNLSTLSGFRHRKKFFAQNGKDGSSKNCSGKNGNNLVILVPCGTMIKNAENDSLMCDMDKIGMTFVAAHGGKGGAGNARFKSSVNRSPKYAKQGKSGEHFEICLELKLLADVGLIGMPNAGKSTIISAISNAKPKVANYPFTTLSPVLGVVDIFDKSFVVADIPGLIEGASLGLGLGHKFLKHVQRCKILVHVVDVSSEKAIENFEMVNQELQKFDKNLEKFPMLVVANKNDVANERNVLKFEDYIVNKKLKLFKISAIKGRSALEKLIQDIYRIIPN